MADTFLVEYPSHSLYSYIKQENACLSNIKIPNILPITLGYVTLVAETETNIPVPYESQRLHHMIGFQTRTIHL